MTEIRRHPEPRRGGFTILELLVVVAILGILVSILLPALAHAKKCAVITGELSAGRQFIQAHTMYSNDHTGRVMPGMLTRAMSRNGEFVVRDSAGVVVKGEAARRYPWRLLPYVGFELGLLYRDRSKIEELAASTEPDDFRYAVSIAPRMGLNQQFVGGTEEAALVASPTRKARIESFFGKRWWVDRVTDVRQPSMLLAFASANHFDAVQGLEFDGYFRIEPPYFPTRKWPTTPPNESTQAGQYGFLTFRFLQKTVAAMMDGHAESLTWEESQDMRHWAPRATHATWPNPEQR